MYSNPHPKQRTSNREQGGVHEMFHIFVEVNQNAVKTFETNLHRYVPHIEAIPKPYFTKIVYHI
jgi:hypothetical protein